MVSNPQLKILAAAALAVAALWLAWPMFSPVHVEGFTASIGSIALHLGHDRLANYDRLFPFNQQFFGFSRLGTNLFVALLAGPLGLPVECALRATMGLGFVCLSGGSYVLVRRWTKAPPLVALLVMVLTPGLVEAGYYYNDNMLSAGLATLSLAVLALSARPAATIAGGALFGYAVLARTDCLLIAPAAALVLWRREGWSGRLVLQGALFGLVSAGSACAVLAAFGQTPFTVLTIAAHAVALWDRHTDWTIQPSMALAFAGPISLDLAAIGLVVLARDRRAYSILLLAGVPLLYNLVYLGKVWEARQLTPLTPFLLSLAATGVQALMAANTRLLRALVVAASAIAVLILIAPPPPPTMWEGPRATRGRLWTPMMWRRWQQSAQGSFDAVGRFVGQPPAPLSAVVTDIWDADRYVHLQLQERGYRPIDVGAAWPACAGIAEAFQRGDGRIVHLRLHSPFLADWRLRLADRFDGPGRACLAQARPGAVTMVTSLSRMDRILAGAGPDTPWIAQARRLADGGRWLPSGDLDPLAGRRLTTDLQASLSDRLRKDGELLLKLATPEQRARLLARPLDPTLSMVR